jgi:hypothetical protein
MKGASPKMASSSAVAPLPRSGRSKLADGPCVAKETARYRVTFGILGKVAEAELSLALGNAATSVGAAAPSLLIRTKGSGSGDVLGFGKTDKRIEGDFDARALSARRWRNVKIRKGKTTIDTAEQAKPGAVSLLRKRAGEPDQAEHFDRAAPVLDPLGFLVRLRLALPEASMVYEVLDGRALWLAKVAAARVDPAAADLLRVDGKLEPIFWNGDPDQRRSTFTFSLFFRRDRFRTPVRLTVPYGLGEVRAELVRVERRPGERGKAPDGSLSCEKVRRRSLLRELKQRRSQMGPRPSARGRARR